MDVLLLGDVVVRQCNSRLQSRRFRDVVDERPLQERPSQAMIRRVACRVLSRP